MSKLKKTLIIVSTLVLLVASFAISSFALPSEEALEGSSLPKVSFSGVRSSGEFYTGTDVMFPDIDTDDVLPAGIYYAQTSGDVNGSIRNRWSYTSTTDITKFPFQFEMATNNFNYDVIIDFPLLGLSPNTSSDISWDFWTYYSVTQAFGGSATDINYFEEDSGLEITLVFVDARGVSSPNANFTGDGFYVYKTDAPVVNSLISHLLDHTTILDDTLNSELEGYVALSRMVISRTGDSIDDYYATRGVINLDSVVNTRYTNALAYERDFIQNGLNSFNDRYMEGYDDGLDVGYDIGYDVGYNDGYDVGYDIGYDNGVFDGADNAIEEMGVFSIFTKSIDALMDFPLFDLPDGGYISLGLLLGVIVGALAFVWLLKLIAGG